MYNCKSYELLKLFIFSCSYPLEEEVAEKFSDGFFLQMQKTRSAETSVDLRRC